MKKLKKMKLSQSAELMNDKEMRMIMGGYSASTDCSTTCPNGDTISITDCNGSCTATDGVSVKCVGSTQTLEKSCR